ncbi:MAG TPA: glucose 1-dehydrogenase [Brevibacillus sp.]|nr:glucose 1-dehydrogenase [Brevibacillus sp.]
MTKLSGKTAVVTGAAQGIGKAIALRLAKEGANVAVVDRNEEKLIQTANEIKELGKNSKGYMLDLKHTDAIAPLYETIAKDFGRIDIAVHAAGVALTKDFMEITGSDWDFVMDVNAKALFFCVQQAAKQMMATGGGRIINFASIAGKQPTKPDLSVYGASKAAVLSITKTAAANFAASKISVNAVCPGVVHTAMWDQIDSDRARIYNQPIGKAIENITGLIPLGRLAELDEIAGLVAYLSSPEAEYITGQSINICGGMIMS